MDRTEIVNTLAAAIADKRTVRVSLTGNRTREFVPRVFKNNGPGSLTDGTDILYWGGLIAGGVPIADILSVEVLQDGIVTTTPTEPQSSFA